MITDQPVEDINCAQWQQDLSNLLEWLKTQEGGADTFYEFQRRSLALRVNNQGYAAFLRIMADMAVRFANIYDGEPLDVSIARGALTRLTEYVKQAASLNAAEAQTHLDLLNQIGFVELMPYDRRIQSRAPVDGR